MPFGFFDVTAKNVVENATNTLFSSITEIVQDNSTKASASQILNIIDAQNIDLSNIDMTQFISINVDAVMNATASNDFDQKLDEKVKQASKAVGTALTLNPGSTTSENVTKTLNNLAVQLKSSFSQNCSGSFSADQQFNIINSSGVKARFLNFQQIILNVRKCTMESKAVNDVRNELLLLIDQEAYSEVKGLFDGFALLGLIVVMALVAGAFIIFNKVSGALTSPTFYMVLLAVLGVFGFIVYPQRLFPYKNEKQIAKAHPNGYEDREDYMSAKSRNKTILIACGVFLGLDVLAIGGYTLYKKMSGKNDNPLDFNKLAQSYSQSTPNTSVPSNLPQVDPIVPTC